MPDTYAPSGRANRVADWIETTCLERGTTLGAAALDALGAEVGYRDTDVALGIATMGRRQAVLGDAYPFHVASGVAATIDAPTSVWTSMLLMSPGGKVRASLDVPAASAHFERITATALESLFGPGTAAVRFAWPSDDGRPQSFPDAVRWLAKEMRVPVGGAYRPPQRKDGGVDVIAWRAFPDGRSGFPVVLAQCTIENDYAHKASDIDLRVWSGWLRLDVDPSTALAVPGVVAAGAEWNRLAARTTILDRIRLTSLVPTDLQSASLEQVRAWTGHVLDEIRDPQ
jgi:hypothetical protein